MPGFSGQYLFFTIFSTLIKRSNFYKPCFMAEILVKTPVRTKHSKALYILFLTEMWERFAYYLMVGILLLYLIDNKTGGKGMDERQGADVVGSFIALVYLTPFIGGLIADRYQGYIRSIFIGGSLMAAGYLCLSIPGNTAMLDRKSVV